MLARQPLDRYWVLVGVLRNVVQGIITAIDVDVVSWGVIGDYSAITHISQAFVALQGSPNVLIFLQPLLLLLGHLCLLPTFIQI